MVASNALTAVLQLGAFAIAARALDLDVLGTLLIIQTYVRVVDGLFNFQSVNVLTRFLGEAHENHDEERFAGLVKAGFLVDAGTAVIAVAITWLSLPILGPVFGIEGNYLTLAFLYSAVIFSRTFGAGEAALRCYDSFLPIGIRPAAHAAMLLVGSAASWAAHADAKVFLYVWLGSEAVANLGFIAWSLRTVQRRNHHSIARANARATLAGSRNFWPMMWQTNATFAIRMLSQDADILLAGGILGPAAAGLLKAAKSLSSVIGQIGRPLQQVVSSPLARMAARENFDAMRSYSGMIGGMAALAGLFATLLMVLMGEQILIVIFGEEFAEAYWVTAILFLARCIYLAGATLLPLMLALDIGDKFLRAVVVGSVLYCILLGAVEPLGLIGIGLAHLAFELGWAASGWSMANKEIQRRLCA